MRPIYEPKGAAKEYGDYALNIYTGCPHRCYYCFAPSVLRKDREKFHSCVEPRKNIVEETRKQIEREGITGKTIHLCFACDPYPTGYDTTPTREIIKILKESGNHVQILTKGDGRRDFDLLDGDDWYGITYAGYYDRIDKFKPPTVEPMSEPVITRLASLEDAHEKGIKTWVSMEPVLEVYDVEHFLSLHVDYIDHYKIGKLNYCKFAVDWKHFGEDAEKICKSLGIDYYIKESLRKCMEVKK